MLSKRHNFSSHWETHTQKTSITQLQGMMIWHAFRTEKRYEKTEKTALKTGSHIRTMKEVY